MDAVDLQLSAIAGAMIVVSGGVYALLLALGHLRGSKLFLLAALVAYLLLVVFTFVLADRLGFSAAWYPVVAVMLVGYLVAPKAIWHLTDATHGNEHSARDTRVSGETDAAFGADR